LAFVRDLPGSTGACRLVEAMLAMANAAFMGLGASLAGLFLESVREGMTSSMAGCHFAWPRLSKHQGTHHQLRQMIRSALTTKRSGAEPTKKNG
jgi:hypothetical protein